MLQFIKQRLLNPSGRGGISVDLSEIATLMGVVDPESFDYGIDGDSFTYDYVYREALREAIDDEKSESEAEEYAEGKAMEAESKDYEDAFSSYRSNVESVFDRLLGNVGMTLDITEKSKGRGKEKYKIYQYKIEPVKSWDDAASQIRQLVNGVGHFHFYTMKDFLDSGPYTPRQAVESHLSYLKRYHEVYGGSSPSVHVNR